MRSALILSVMMMFSTVGCGGGSEEISQSNNGVAPTPPADIPKPPSKPIAGSNAPK